jgi:hypothetical protein
MQGGSAQAGAKLRKNRLLPENFRHPANVTP